MTYGELFKADADYGDVVRELVRVETKLRVAREIAEDFRENTSLGTIVREYEARVKELERQINWNDDEG
jgi:predicted Ser/Thr protein kinase